MDIEEVIWNGEYDGETFELLVENDILLGCHWKSNDPKFVLLYMHGLCSAVTFNANVLRIFPNFGGCVLACDHKGHGRSPGGRSQTTIPHLTEEIRQLILYSRIIYPKIPIFLMGHSLGGLSSLSFIMSRTCVSSLIKGLILTSPWLKAAKFKNPPKWMRIGLALGAKLIPSYGLNTGLDVSRSTYPQGYKDMVSKSSYMLTKASPLLLNSVLSNMEWIAKNPNEFPSEIPILFFQGKSDSLVCIDTNIQWANIVCKNSKSKTSKLIIYDNAPHDIMKSYGRKDSFLQILEFINKNI